MPPTTLNSEEPDNRYEVIPYFMNNQEISGLADVDM